MHPYPIQKSRRATAFPGLTALLLVLVSCAAPAGARAAEPAPEAASTTEWKFQIGLAYASGMSDLSDAMENAAYVEISSWPVGACASATMSFNDAFGIGGSFGPAVLMYGDVSGYILPLGLDVRYNFMPHKQTSLYVRAGVRHLVVSGDLLGDGTAGFCGGLGLAFNRDRAVAFGLEALVDTSEVEVTDFGGYVTESVKPFNFMIGAFIEF